MDDQLSRREILLLGTAFITLCSSLYLILNQLS